MIFLAEQPASPFADGRKLATGLAVIAIAAALGWWIARGPSRSADPEALWNAARSDLDAGRFDQAVADIERLAAIRDPLPQDWVLKGQAALAKEQTEEALRCFAQVHDSHSMGPASRLKQGQIELRRHRVRKAEEFYLRAVALDPKLEAAHSELIYIYGFQLRRKELRERYQLLSQCRPLTFHDVFLWCLTRETNWEAQEAVGMLEKWSQADPDDRWSRIALADNLRALNRLDDARTVLKTLPDDDQDALEVRARLAIDLGQTEEVERLLKQGAKDRPGLLRLRGKLALYQRDWPAAIQAFRQAFEAEPDERDGLAGLVQALKAANDPEAAKFQSLLDAHGQLITLVQNAKNNGSENDPKQLRRLGEICAKVDRLPEARAWLQLAIELDPLDQEAQAALFRLRGQTKNVER